MEQGAVDLIMALSPEGDGQVLTCTVSCEADKITWPEVIKLFSSSTQLSMKFKLLIIIEITKFG